MINCTVSMFGDLGVGFTSYPNEKATNEVFQTFRDKVWAHSSLVTHRDGRKMYYAYLRQIVGKQYICFCVMLNDAYFTNLRELFTLFEEVFNDVQKQGVILGNDSKGRLIAKVKNLSSQQEEVDRITGYIRQRIEMEKDVEYPLPQIGELTKWSEDDIEDRRFEWDYMSDKVYKECLVTDYIVISKNSLTGNVWLQAPVPIVILVFLMPVAMAAFQIYFYFDKSLRRPIEFIESLRFLEPHLLFYALGCLACVIFLCKGIYDMSDSNTSFRKIGYFEYILFIGYPACVLFEGIFILFLLMFAIFVALGMLNMLLINFGYFFNPINPILSIILALVGSCLFAVAYSLMAFLFSQLLFLFYRVSRTFHRKIY